MFRMLRQTLRTGIVTTAYPDARAEPPPGFRGKPAVDPQRCRGSGACARACPTQAIAVAEAPGGASRWHIHLGRCIFCGLCADVCPNAALRLTAEFELATARPDGMIESLPVRIGGAAR